MGKFLLMIHNSFQYHKDVSLRKKKKNCTEVIEEIVQKQQK